MTKRSCEEIFDLGSQRRKSHQLHAGVYKLREVEGWYSAMIEEIHEIIKYKKGLTVYPFLNHCTTWDIAQWLKGIPGNVAYDLGYYLLPGVAALEGDKVPRQTVVAMTSRFTRQAQVLVNACQEVQGVISKSIAVEYSHMRQGQSLVLPLLQRAESLFHLALAQSTQSTQPAPAGALSGP